MLRRGATTIAAAMRVCVYAYMHMCVCVLEQGAARGRGCAPGAGGVLAALDRWKKVGGTGEAVGLGL